MVPVVQSRCSTERGLRGWVSRLRSQQLQVADTPTERPQVNAAAAAARVPGGC